MKVLASPEYLQIMAEMEKMSAEQRMDKAFERYVSFSLLFKTAHFYFCLFIRNASVTPLVSNDIDGQLIFSHKI